MPTQSFRQSKRQTVISRRRAGANGDNVYELTVAASDGSLSDTQALLVTVTDVSGWDSIDGRVHGLTR